MVMTTNKKNNKTILACDPSLTGSAWILGTSEGEILGYNYFSALKSDIRNNEHCKEIQEGLTSKEKLDNLINFYLQIVNKVDLLVMEAPSYNSVNANNEFKYSYGILEWLSRRLDVDVLLITPISLKLYFTDNARAEKDDMLQEAEKIYGNIIDFNNISKKHRYDVADCSAVYNLGVNYLTCNRLPAPKGCVDTCDIKPYDMLPLHQKQVIAKLYNREDLYKEAKKIRDKQKKNIDKTK